MRTTDAARVADAGQQQLQRATLAADSGEGADFLEARRGRDNPPVDSRFRPKPEPESEAFLHMPPAPANFLLEALLAEHGTTLRRAERHGCPWRTPSRLPVFRLTPNARRGGPGCSLGLAGLASLGFVLEVLVREEELLSRRPHEFRVAVHAREDSVLELHHSPLLARALTPRRVAVSSGCVCAPGPAWPGACLPAK
jgi:hypothetical protein